jgi:hypothetical protein
LDLKQGTLNSYNHFMHINILAPEYGISILAHPSRRMWIIQEPKKVALRNKQHFEEKKMEIMQHV